MKQDKIYSNTLCKECRIGLLKFDGIRKISFDNKTDTIIKIFKCTNCGLKFKIKTHIFISKK